MSDTNSEMQNVVKVESSSDNVSNNEKCNVFFATVFTDQCGVDIYKNCVFISLGNA